MSRRVIRSALLAAFAIAALAIFCRVVFAQAVQPSTNPTDNPNQINVTNGYLYLNKIHYAGTWSATVTYNSQDLVISSSLPYISLQAANLNNAPSSSPLEWFPLPGGAASAVWGTITGTLSSQTDLNTALALALAKASNLSDLASASTARTNLGLGNVQNTALSTWAGSTDLTTLGTIATGVWNGTAIGAAYVATLNQSTTGNAATATALASSPSECSAGSYPLGINASGTAQSCTALPTFPSGTVVGTSDTQTLTNKSIAGSEVNSGTVPAAQIPSNIRIRAIGYTFDGGGSALVAPLTRYLTVPFACTMSAWNILVDTGTATVKTWKIAAGTAIPTVSNTLSTSGVSIATGTAIHSATMTDFSSTTVSANDIFGFNLSASASATIVNFILECDQ